MVGQIMEYYAATKKNPIASCNNMDESHKLNIGEKKCTQKKT